MLKKIILPLLLTVINIYAHEPKTYWQEWQSLEISEKYKIIFDEDAPVGLHSVRRDIENFKQLTFFQRLVRFAFLSLDTLVITPELMPQLYSYVDSLCKQNDLTTPTIFITTQDGLFNAAAQKLLMSSGAIVIGKKLLQEVSDQELEAVIAHEIGHIKHNHVNKILLITLPLYFFLAKCLAPSFSPEATKRKIIIDCMGAEIQASFLAQLVAAILINKRFEKEADNFAFENGKAQGLKEFFERLAEKDALHDTYFDETSCALCDAKSQVSFRDYLFLNISYYLSKTVHQFDKGVRWIYHNTPYGAHPSPQARIAAAKEFLTMHN